jgi:hypothetical protein
MFVVSKDGFIDWARSSPALFKSGVFIRARQETIPIPQTSLAALGPSKTPLESSARSACGTPRSPSSSP